MAEKNLEIIDVESWVIKMEDPKNTILDIRTKEEFDEFHIDNAINIDFYNEDHKLNLNKLDRTKTYLTYCKTGSRSKHNLELMERLGFDSIYDLKDGIIAYHELMDSKSSNQTICGKISKKLGL